MQTFKNLNFINDTAVIELNITNGKKLFQHIINSALNDDVALQDSSKKILDYINTNKLEIISSELQKVNNYYLETIEKIKVGNYLKEQETKLTYMDYMDLEDDLLNPQSKYYLNLEEYEASLDDDNELDL